MLAGAGVGKTPKVEAIGVLGADGEEEDQEKGRSARGAAVGQGPAPLSPGVARPLSRHGSQRNLQLRLQG